MRDRPVWRPAPAVIPAILLALALYIGAGVALAFLLSCTSTGTGPAAVPQTPRELLYAAEVSYTAAANEANSVAPLLNAAQKAALLKAYEQAGQALNMAESTVSDPACAQQQAACSGMVAQAQVLVQALIAAVAQAKGGAHA